MAYIEFRNYALEFCEETNFLSCFTYDAQGRRLCFFNGRFAGKLESCVSAPDPLFTGELENLFWLFKLTFRLPGKRVPVEVETVIFDDRIEIRCPKGAVTLAGVLKQGKRSVKDLLLMRSSSLNEALHGCSGPVPLPGADLLYDRQSDNAVRFSGKYKIAFDWKKKQYILDSEISARKPLVFRFERHFCQQICHTRYWKGISHSHGFQTPPVGWMTWYAVRFDACEKIVLENAAAMKKHFGNFCGKIVIWVDWEWCHKKMSYHSEEGVDVFNCRKEAYPNGMKYLSDKIKEMGLVPALWTGAANDGNLNEYFRKNPDLCLADVLNWAGRYWADLSHPVTAKEYIPAVFKNLLSWGYEHFKWDCLLNAMRFNDEYRADRYDPEMTTDEAFHKVVAAGRKVFGNKVYLLGCTGMERATMAAIDLFDACRIGGDVFSWEDFKKNAVIPIFSYFLLHNTAVFLDPDTLVLREEYSTLEQARSRVSLFALTGMQLTVGDALSALDAPRIDAVKRAVPVAEITPGEMCRKNFSGEVACVFVSAARPWGVWHTAGVFNLTDETKKYTVTLENIPEGKYAVFEFWKKEFYGIREKSFEVTLPPGGCAVFRLTPFEERVFLMGSSRHLLQGVVELKELKEKENFLSGTVEVVEGDDVQLYFYIPDGCTVTETERLVQQKNQCVLTIPGERSGRAEFQIKYKGE